MADFHDPASERKDRLAQQIADISKALEVVADTDFARMPERNFVQVFLPFFAGDTDLMYKVDMTHWLNFAGGPYREVQVIDNKGVVLFNVPPIYDRTAINPLSGESHSIAHVVATTTQYARIHPVQGQNYLSAELTKRALVMKVPAAVMHHIDVWNAIFTRYNRPPLIAMDDKPSDAPAAAKDHIDDDDYESL